MSDAMKKKLWILWILLGAVPGVVLWLFLVKAGYAGEFAGVLIGFGAVALYRWSGAELKYSKMIVGAILLLAIAIITNQLGYSLDIYNKFAENWYGAAGNEFTFGDAFTTVWDSFVVKNAEGMRKFYIEAAIQGILCSLLFWIALFVYYRKLDELENGEGE